ncbi:MAG TPA: hypothetical protein VFU15_07325, partial [Bacteroidia bacterium]|nr:hypothetical protein [Bacteroidia bacterium]
MLGAAFAVYYPDANSLAQSGTGPFGNLWTTFNANAPKELTWMDFAPFIAFLIPLFSALRLAKFNNDKRQTDSFIGVPTPANSILICSFVLILRFSRLWIADWPADIGGAPGPSYARKIFNLFMQSPPANAGLRVNGGWAPGVSFAESLLLNPWFLVAVTLVMSFLLVAEIPLFALKFKNFGWKGNEVRYLFLILSVALAALLQFTGVPLVIVLYVLLSVVNNAMKKKSGGAPGGAETPGS